MDRFWEHGVPNLSLFPFPVVEEFRDSTIGDDRFNFWKRGFAGRMLVKLSLRVEQLKRTAWLLRNGAPQLSNPGVDGWTGQSQSNQGPHAP
jgi:hypothetical protein